MFKTICSSVQDSILLNFNENHVEISFLTINNNSRHELKKFAERRRVAFEWLCLVLGAIPCRMDLGGQGLMVVEGSYLQQYPVEYIK